MALAAVFWDFDWGGKAFLAACLGVSVPAVWFLRCRRCAVHGVVVEGEATRLKAGEMPFPTCTEVRYRYVHAGREHRGAFLASASVGSLNGGDKLWVVVDPGAPSRSLP